MTPYHQLVGRYLEVLSCGKSLPLGGFAPAARPLIPPTAPKVLFFAPHPDDECISGGLALRLMREAQFRVFNVAVTLGSKKQRQAGRLAELKNACGYLGFELITTSETGLQRVNLKTRAEEGEHWAASVRVIKDILERHQPRILIFPHERDWNSTHIGTHFLLMDALSQMPADFECHLVMTEFWGAMADPNVIIEIAPNDLADMMAATTFHVGEVQRNPYHLSLPAWMMDNVRRGAEVAGGQGNPAPDFAFAVLNRLSYWKNGQLQKRNEDGTRVPSSKNAGDLFS
jgi:LmbE family N-acetylglucosaminyl deacetylase